MSGSTSAHQPPELHVYADAMCRTRDQREFAGYGVYAPVHSIRVAEPVPGKSQAPDKAELHALHSAMELIHGVRARVAVVYIHSHHVVDAYDNSLRHWHANRWRTNRGRRVKNRKIWRLIWDLWNVFLDRGVDVALRVKERGSEHNMRVATRLARHGAALHVTCELCRKTHGRQWGNHSCQPICDLDKCDGRVLKHVHAYMKHMQRKHQRKCRRKDCEEQFSTFVQEELEEHEREAHGGKVFDCPFCGKYFKSNKKVKRHIRSACREAPFCADCGRLFKNKRDLQRHNERKASQTESSTSSSSSSSSSSDTEGGNGPMFGDTDAGMDEVGMDLARHDFGRHGFGGGGARQAHRRGDYVSDGEGDDGDDDSDSSSSSLSWVGSERDYRRRRRHSHHGHSGQRHGHEHGKQRHGHGQRHGRRHRHHHHHHHHRRHGNHSHSHSHGSRGSHGSSQGSRSSHADSSRQSGGRGLELAAREGRDWLVEEFERRRQQMAQSDGELMREARWQRYGHGSE